MKKIWFMLVCLSAAALSLTGCGGSGNNVGQENQFPKFLAGTWDCNDNNEGLVIVFEPNGAIASAVEPFGKPKMGPGERVDFNNVKTGGKGFYEAGLFTADYKPATRELKVELTIERYRVETEDGGVIEGKSTDILIGKVSKNGKIWQAEWYAIPEYYVTTDIYKNFKVPSDPNDVFEPQGTFTFRKVSSP
ncbi:MAG: hypothetical protein ABSA64_02850 [Sedimentisphaerales bacterium]|jgi:hypothetical protein